MITIRLLGGAKKAVGKSSISLDRPAASVAEILQFLSGVSTDSRILQPSNLIVALNGVDSSALHGPQTIAKSGDTVTIVTVVHGGTSHAIGRFNVLIIGIGRISEDPGKVVDRLRAGSKDLSIQMVDANAVYGMDHVLEILRMTLETEKRGIMIANKRDTELLLRLAFTGQISEAIRRAGLKRDSPGCLIAFSQNKEELDRFSDKVRNEFQEDDSVLAPDKEKKSLLASLLGTNAKFDDAEFLQYLLERAAIMVK